MQPIVVAACKACLRTDGLGPRAVAEAVDVLFGLSGDVLMKFMTCVVGRAISWAEEGQAGKAREVVRQGLHAARQQSEQM